MLHAMRPTAPAVPGADCYRRSEGMAFRPRKITLQSLQFGCVGAAQPRLRLHSRHDRAKLVYGTDVEGIAHLRRKAFLRQSWLGTRVALAAAVSTSCALGASAEPTPEEYVGSVAGDAKLVAAGQLKIDGQPLQCGKRPTVLYDNLDDYGAA